MRRVRALGAALLAVAPALAAAQDFPALEGAHPVLITVDDLPIASARMHPDDAGRERLTRDLLAVLRRHDIKAVGFVTWRNVRDAAGERLLDLWLKDGHELGNHSYTHPDYPSTATEDYVADMEKARATLGAFLEARGRRLRYFRFPFLREGDTPAKLARMREWLPATGQRSVPVTIDTQDWSFEEPWVTAQRKPDTPRLARLAEDYQHALRLQSLVYTAAGDALFERPTPQILLIHANAVGAAQWDALFTWMKGRGFRFASAGRGPGRSRAGGGARVPRAVWREPLGSHPSRAWPVQSPGADRDAAGASSRGLEPRGPRCVHLGLRQQRSGNAWRIVHDASM